MHSIHVGYRYWVSTINRIGSILLRTESVLLGQLLQLSEYNQVDATKSSWLSQRNLVNVTESIGQWAIKEPLTIEPVGRW